MSNTDNEVGRCVCVCVWRPNWVNTASVFVTADVPGRCQSDPVVPSLSITPLYCYVYIDILGYLLSVTSSTRKGKHV